MLIHRHTGNVMVCPAHLGSPVDVRIPPKSSSSYGQSVEAFKRWAVACRQNPSRTNTDEQSTTPTLIQLCHSGRQAMRMSAPSLFDRPKAPSAVGVSVGEGVFGRALGNVVFGSPKEMTVGDIDEVVRQFVDGAKLAHETGFDGVQLHGSHGYLLAQFLSPNVSRARRLRRGTGRPPVGLDGRRS